MLLHLRPLSRGEGLGERDRKKISFFLHYPSQARRIGEKLNKEKA